MAYVTVMPPSAGDLLSATRHLTSIIMLGALMKKAHLAYDDCSFRTKVPFSLLELRSLHTALFKLRSQNRL